jgi:hypothetical protein
MKTTLSKKKKAVLTILSVIIALIIIVGVGLIFLYSYSSKIEESSFVISSSFSATVDVNNDEVVIKSWENTKDNKHYLFLPSDADVNSISLNCDNASSLTIDGESVNLNEKTDKLADLGEFEIKFDSTKYDVVVLKSENVPSVHIETEEATLDDIMNDKSLKTKSNIKIYSDGENIVNDELKYLKGRGNASWNNPQKSFNIKFNNKTDLFNMGKAKKYSLISTYCDQTLIKNNVAFSIAESIGLDYTSKYQQVDLYIDNNYLGSYLLVESVEVGKNRIDINDLDKANEDANPDVDLDEVEILTNDDSLSSANNSTQKWADIENNPEDITSGYLLEIELTERYSDESCGFVSANGQPLVIKSPEYATKDEVAYISSFYQEFEDALYSDDGYNDLGKSYTDYIDLTSFAKVYLIQ